MCPLFKTSGMMKALVHYYDCAKKTIVESSGENRISFGVIQTAT